MTRLRRVLSVVAVACLACQTVTFMFVPAVLLAGANVAECTCPSGADASCPMHHHQAADSKGCAMRSLTTTGLYTLLGTAGFVAGKTTVMIPVPTSSPIAFTHSIEHSRFTPPDPPPPRA